MRAPEDSPPIASAIIDEGWPSDLPRRTRLGAVQLVGRLVALRLVTFVGTLVVARLLLPAEYGLFAIALAAATLIGPLGELGLGPALVQQAEAPTERRLDAIWTWQLLASLLVTVVAWATVAAAVLLGVVSSDGGSLFAAAAVAIVVAHLQSVPGAVLARRLSFGRLGLVEICGQVVYFATAVVLALNGSGAWSLVAGLLFQNVFGALALHASWGRLPRIVVDRAEVAALLPFGTRIAAISYLNVFRDALPPLLGPLAGGTAAAGQLQLGLRVGRLAGGLDEVAAQLGLPAFSRLGADRARLAHAVREGFETIALILALPIAWLVAVAPVLVPLLFGDQWRPAVPVVQAAAVAALIAPHAQVLRAVALAHGRAGSVLRWSAVALAVLAVGLGAGLIGLGLVGGGLALLAYAFALAIGYTLIVRDLTPVPWPSAAVTWFLAGVSAIPAYLLTTSDAGVAALLISALSAAAGFGTLLLIIERPLARRVARRVSALRRP